MKQIRVYYRTQSPNQKARINEITLINPLQGYPKEIIKQKIKRVYCEYQDLHSIKGIHTKSFQLRLQRYWD